MDRQKLSIPHPQYEIYIKNHIINSRLNLKHLKRSNFSQRHFHYNNNPNISNTELSEISHDRKNTVKYEGKHFNHFIKRDTNLKAKKKIYFSAPRKPFFSQNDTIKSSLRNSNNLNQDKKTKLFQSDLLYKKKHNSFYLDQKDILPEMSKENIFKNTYGMSIKNKYLIQPFQNVNYERKTNYTDANNDTIFSINKNNYHNAKKLLIKNQILQKQNQKLQQKINEAKNKVNELLNNINMLKIENQKLNNENNQLLLKIIKMEDELNYSKNITFDELKSKNKLINKLNDGNEKKKLLINYNQKHNFNKNIKEESESSLSNIANIFVEKLNQNNNYYYNKNDNIFENLDLNEFIKQIDLLQKKIEEMKYDKQLDEQKFNQMINNNNEINNEEINKYKIKINEVVKENEKIRNLYSSLNSEYEKLRNYCSINKNSEEINKIKNENKKLKYIIFQSNKKNTNGSNQLSKNIENENQMLKKHIQNLENQIREKNNNMGNSKNQKTNMNLQEIINEYEKKIKILKDEIYNLKNSKTNNIVSEKLIEKKEDYQKNIIDLNKQIIDLKKENEANLKQLKESENKNKELLNLLKYKNIENNELRLTTQNMELPNKFNINDEIEYLKNEIEDKNKEIQTYKEINNKLTLDNQNFREKIELYENDHDEGLLIILDNLKEEIKNKNIQIENLIKQNEIIRKNNLNHIKEEGRKETSSDRENDPFRVTTNSNELTDMEKVHIYKEKVKEYKLINESDQMQIQALKAEIKEIKIKVNYLQTFNGQVKNLKELIDVINKVLLGYKPKKKEQKEAFEKLIQILAAVS